MSREVCIIGGGVGGLTTGAILAKEGCRVMVVEKNSIVGGGLQTFYRANCAFNPGMHLFGGMGTNGQLNRIYRYLGIDLKDTIEECHDAIFDTETGRLLRLPTGREAWEEAWCRFEGMQPTFRKEIHAYLDRIYSLTESEPLFLLKEGKTKEDLPVLSLSATELLDQTFSQEESKRLMRYAALFYAGHTNTPALIHAIITRLHIEGMYAFRGASVDLAHKLEDIICQQGGEIMSGAEATGFRTEGGKITHLLCTKGSIEAETYISTIPLLSLLNIAPREAFSAAFRKRIGTAAQTHSAFTLYIALKPKRLPHRGEALYIGLPETKQKNSTHPQLFLQTSPDPENETYARGVSIICPMDYEACEKWAESKTGKRPKEYTDWKTEQAREIISYIDSLHIMPPLEEASEQICAASPLTIRDYYGNSRGSLYGLQTSSEQPLATHLSPRTRIPNLLLGGQEVNFHGLVGVSLTSLLTAEAVLGEGRVTEKIVNKQQ